jgi:hypothetical protein
MKSRLISKTWPMNGKSMRREYRLQSTRTLKNQELPISLRMSSNCSKSKTCMMIEEPVQFAGLVSKASTVSNIHSIGKMTYARKKD